MEAVTFWLTGLSGAGKTTIGEALVLALRKQHVPCVLLDGDAVRRGLCSNLGFSPEDRSENVRRIAEVARMMNDSGVSAVVAAIAPSFSDRQMARNCVGSASFREIYVSTPLDVCESRDPKGLYARARAGTLPGFTGIDAPYEEPSNPTLRLDTVRLSVPECVAQCLACIVPRRVCSGDLN
jgi:adenylylsulfate kinase